ncbi:hypothetical protein K443DRAFT_8260 [Laccaria amethystina LaAM-08-1]|uniref:Uncharacterized protein n=1 Tax=Laccaria amethystina LaAM-08-1 TaxID=1095629 RepID=A0A0C9XPR1_9AGAR|nr:hypothetical protein K443DRAFT_8260 [Laccaria amethystina LaAM-08-1]
MPAKPKSTSRKRQQSNADESANKHNKTVENDSDAAIAVEEANEAGKGGKKGKKTGAKGKNKKTWADCQQEDQIENAKGTPARLQLIEQKLLAAGTSVAPPECPAHLQVVSKLPPAPTISSSCTRINHE